MTKKCTWCETKLNAEEIKLPRQNEHAETICDECYTDNYLYPCQCGNYYSRELWNKLPGAFQVLDSEIIGMPVGVYEAVVSPKPFGHTNFMEAWLKNEHFVWWVCPECAERWRSAQ